MGLREKKNMISESSERRVMNMKSEELERRNEMGLMSMWEKKGIQKKKVGILFDYEIYC